MRMLWVLLAAAIVLTALAMALRGYPDWSLRRAYPMYTSTLIRTGFSVNANSEYEVINVTGKGQVDGLSFRFIDVDVLVYIEIRLYIDEATTPATFTLGSVMIPFTSPAGTGVGRPGSPFTVTLFDTTNKYYGFSVTVPIRFSRSLRITIYNYHTKAIQADAIGFISLEA